MLKRQTCLLTIILLGISSISYAQICMKEVTPQTMAYNNFSFPAPGQARDELSKRVWDRCVYGQIWDSASNNCLGNPAKLTWKEALVIGENTNRRLPDIKELNSIMDMQCIIPPTNLRVFPNTPGSTVNGLWTSTPFIVPKKENGNDITNAWFFDLGFGTAHYRPVDTKNFVRFIHIIPE